MATSFISSDGYSKYDTMHREKMVPLVQMETLGWKHWMVSLETLDTKDPLDHLDHQ